MDASENAKRVGGGTQITKLRHIINDITGIKLQVAYIKVRITEKEKKNNKTKQTQKQP